MKTTQLIAAALILSASVSAFAQQTTSASTEQAKDIGHGKTRAEVTAELQQAEASGKGMPTGFLAYDAPAKASTAMPSATAVAHK